MKSFISVLPLASLAAAAVIDLRASNLAPGIKFLGRVNPANLQLTWPSTGVAFAFTGTNATIGVTGINGLNSMALYIDDLDPTDISNVYGDIVVPTLDYGVHVIQLRKRSEDQYGYFSLTNVTSDGAIDTSGKNLKLPKRQIEIIGDSISVGYGIDGVYPCVNAPVFENSPETYGAKAANMLNADYSIVAWSGKGLTRNYVTLDGIDTSPIMPELWTRYGANDADNSYTFPGAWNPDAVVIHLGTNDFSYLAYNSTSGANYPARPPVNSTVLTTAATAFIRTVHKHYKKANFFLMGSPLLSDSYPTAADAQHTTDANIWKAAGRAVAAQGISAQFVDWPTQGNVYGCDNHPNALTNMQEAVVLADAISASLDW